MTALQVTVWALPESPVQVSESIPYANWCLNEAERLNGWVSYGEGPNAGKIAVFRPAGDVSLRGQRGEE